MSRSRRWMSVALAVAVVCAAGDAVAARKKNTVTATIGGKSVKFRSVRRVSTTYDPRAGVVTIAQKLGPVIRTLGFGCAFPLPVTSFPFTPDPAGCTANYTETTRRGLPRGSWLAVRDVNVSYAAYAGGRLTGTFSAVLDPASGAADGPLAVQGTFDTAVTQ